jgi:hypothetical protein
VILTIIIQRVARVVFNCEFHEIGFVWLSRKRRKNEGRERRKEGKQRVKDFGFVWLGGFLGG